MSNRLFSNTEDEPSFKASFFWSLFFWVALTSAILWLCGIAQFADEIVFTLASIFFVGKTMHDEGVAEEKILGVGYVIALLMTIASWAQGHIGIHIPLIVVGWGIFAFLSKKGSEWWIGNYDKSEHDEKEGS